MALPYNILIENGTGNAQIVNGDYAVTAAAAGYNPISIDPAAVTVAEDTNTYAFTIAATGTLTLHVTETGAPTIPIVGASFRRCDSGGTEAGPTIVTDVNGEADFPFVPFAAADAPQIYFKQLTSDGNHNFIQTVQSRTMATSEETMEITNALPTIKSVTLTDFNYPDLPIEDALITLS